MKQSVQTSSAPDIFGQGVSAQDKPDDFPAPPSEVPPMKPDRINVPDLPETPPETPEPAPERPAEYPPE